MLNDQTLSDLLLTDPQDGEPVYRVAEFLPAQGSWTPEQFLRLNDDEGRIELVDGRLEFPPVPTEDHQAVLENLFDRLRDFVRPRGLGTVRSAGIRVRTTARSIREPDVAFMRREHDHRRHNEAWDSADLVAEVVSDDRPSRDKVDKRAEYAAAGIPEYWIADPRDKTLTILTLDSGATEYREAGRYAVGQTARSVLLDGLTVEVAAVFETE
jgi:Uma2 family endonuclease